MQAGFILALIFAILVTVFAIQNANDAPINFLFAKIHISQALVIFISAALGAIIVTFLGLIRQFKFKSKIRELTKKVKSLEDEKILLTNQIENKKKTSLENRFDKDVENYSKDIENTLDCIDDKIVDDKNNI